MRLSWTAQKWRSRSNNEDHEATSPDCEFRGKYAATVWKLDIEQRWENNDHDSVEASYRRPCYNHVIETDAVVGNHLTNSTSSYSLWKQKIPRRKRNDSPGKKMVVNLRGPIQIWIPKNNAKSLYWTRRRPLSWQSRAKFWYCWLFSMDLLNEREPRDVSMRENVYRIEMHALSHCRKTQNLILRRLQELKQDHSDQGPKPPESNGSSSKRAEDHKDSTF